MAIVQDVEPNEPSESVNVMLEKDDGLLTEQLSNPAGNGGPNAAAPFTADKKTNLAAQITGHSSPGFSACNEEYSQSEGMEIDAFTGKVKYQTDSVPERKPVPAEPQDAVITDKEQTCTLSVRCDTIF